MAEDVNFPLDVGRGTGALQGLRQFEEDADRPRNLESPEEESGAPGPAQEERPTNELANLESRSELSSRARAEARVEAQNPADDQESQEDIASAERSEQQANRQVSEDARADSRNLRSQGPAGANELARRATENAVQSPSEGLREGFRIGNDVSDPDRINDFQTSTQADSVQEGTERTNEEAVEVEQESVANNPLQDASTTRELPGEGAGPEGRERLEQIIAPETQRPEDAQRAELQENTVDAGDPRIQVQVNEARAEDEADRARNDPAIDTPDQTIEPVEGPPAEPVQEGLDINPLRGPRPSELRDESDASAVETERGQNISDLI